MIRRDELLAFGPGTTIKGYELVSRTDSGSNDTYLDPIGLGGSGVVFRALQRLHGDTSVVRAVKFFVYRDDIAELTAHKNTGPISTQDFVEEISNISNLKHEYLVKVVDAGIHLVNDVEIPYIVTDFVEGPTLQQVIEASMAETDSSSDAGAVLAQLRESPGAPLELLLRLAAVVRYVHEHGFAHCDIAPKNVFVDVSGGLRPVLGDLGTMKALSRSRDRVFIAGSKSYMSPQALAHLNLEVDWATFLALQPGWDIYAFSATGLNFVDAVVTDPPSWLPALRQALESGKRTGTYATVSGLRDRLEFLRPSHREVGRVPELSGSVSGKSRVLMPVEAPELSDRMRRMIRHPAVVRLANVPQITTVRQLFPGAKNDRYEHSLGVLETVRRYLLALLDEPEVLEHLTAPKIELALVCGLLNNVSRFPYSNIIHEVRQKDRQAFMMFSKEHVMTEVFRIQDEKGRTISDLLEKDFRRVEVTEVLALLLGKSEEFDDSDRFISSLLNSSLDARVIDFVRRDSLHTGIARGEPFELAELLPHLTVRQHRLAIRSTGVSAAEQVLTQRYWLFNRIYWNRPNRAYCAMIRYVLLELMEDAGVIARLREMVLNATENDILDFLCREARALDRADLVAVVAPLRSLGQRPYHTVIDLASSDDGESQRVCTAVAGMNYGDLKRLSEELQESGVGGSVGRDGGGGPRFLIDVPFEPGLPKLGVDIVVIRPNGSVESLKQYSPIVGGINQSFESQLRRLRVFADPEWLPMDAVTRGDVRDQVRSFLLERV